MAALPISGVSRPGDHLQCRAVSIAAIDYGGKRIGIAVSESGVLATPHSVIANEGDLLEKLDRLGRDRDVEMWVVGVARRTRTHAGEEKFARFAEALRQKTCKPVVLWDETLTTAEAEERLRERGAGAAQKKDIDMYAAAVILQSYLDDRARRKP